METKNIFPKEEFATREAVGDNYYKIMIVNVSLKDYQHKDLFPWSLWLGVEVEEKSGPFKMPTEEESTVLNTFEDFIESILKKHSKYHFIGRITHNGNRDIYYYIDDPKLVHKELQNLIKTKSSMRDFQYVIERDDDWKQVSMFYNY